MAMSEEHKAALARGRREARAIKSYLVALESRRPGRPVTSESLTNRIDSLEGRIAAESDPLKRVELYQQKLNAEDQLKALDSQGDMEALEAGFVQYAKPYSERKGISYSAWRSSGVPASVLRDAGVPRTRRT